MKKKLFSFILIFLVVFIATSVFLFRPWRVFNSGPEHRGVITVTIPRPHPDVSKGPKASPGAGPNDFIINDKVSPPVPRHSYKAYLDKKQKLNFTPTIDMCEEILDRIESDFVDNIKSKQLFSGVKEEVKALLFEAGVDYAGAEKLPMSGEIFYRVVKDYSGRVDKDILLFACINGLFRGLNDRYSRFMTPGEYKEFVKRTRDQNYTGIGIRISKKNRKSNVKVLEVYKKGPAYMAGIKKGDFITHIDGKALKGMSLPNASELIVGKINSEVILTIKRNDKVAKISAIRKKIHVPAIHSKVIRGDVGYIKIDTFKAELKTEFHERYNELENKGVKALVVDLRNNPGGLVSSAQYLCGFFLPRGTLISVFKHKKAGLRKVKSLGRRIVFVPTVFLVNDNSASSSEITAGALKDHGAVTIVGARTRGKGSVQRTSSLKEKAGIKLTIEKIFTPNGFPIQRYGITPDIEVNEDPTETGSWDPQLNKATEYLKEKITSSDAQTADDDRARVDK